MNNIVILATSKVLVNFNNVYRIYTDCNVYDKNARFYIMAQGTSNNTLLGEYCSERTMDYEYTNLLNSIERSLNDKENLFYVMRNEGYIESLLK